MTKHDVELLKSKLPVGYGPKLATKYDVNRTVIYQVLDGRMKNNSILEDLYKLAKDHQAELQKIRLLKNDLEALGYNLAPGICGLNDKAFGEYIRLVSAQYPNIFILRITNTLKHELKDIENAVSRHSYSVWNNIEFMSFIRRRIYLLRKFEYRNTNQFKITDWETFVKLTPCE